MKIKTEMKRNSKLIITGILIVLVALASSFIRNIRLSEDRYNKIMCYYIARNITLNADTPEKKICALRNFVHINIHPIPEYKNRLDTKAIDKLVSGIGWCDQQARVFMQLARAIGINTRLLFLVNGSGSSPHSIAEAELPNGRWVIVDPFFNLELRNKKGELASQLDVKEDPAIITDNDKVKLRKPYDKKWSNPDYISIYANTPQYIVEKKGVSIDLLRIVPISWIRFFDKYIADIYISQMQKKFKDEFELKLVKARTYHLIGYYKGSRSLYNEIIKGSKDPFLICKAEYFKALLLKRQKKYTKGISFIDEVIHNHDFNPYKVYMIGLMGTFLEKVGKETKAFEVRKEIEYMLRAI